MFNLEMIGTGNGEEYITGFEKSNMGEILQKTGSSPSRTAVVL
jgi:hypothetical protein